MSSFKRSIESTDAVTMESGRVFGLLSSACLYDIFPAIASKSSNNLPTLKLSHDGLNHNHLI